MAKPHVHAQSSANRFGGKPEDYMKIHKLLDSSREAFGDVRHRAATHTSWFIGKILPKIFGDTITNSDDKVCSVQEIAEHHVTEDLGCIPSLSDYLQEIELHDWMDNGRNGEVPPSRKKLVDIPDRPPTVREIPSDTGGSGFDDFEFEDDFHHNCGGPGVMD